jgi:hypothetical protein
LRKGRIPFDARRNNGMWCTPSRKDDSPMSLNLKEGAYRVAVKSHNYRLSFGFVWLEVGGELRSHRSTDPKVIDNKLAGRAI